MSLRRAIEATRANGPRWLWGPGAAIDLSNFLHRTALGEHRRTLAGQSVLVLTDDQLTAAAAMIELDGLAAQMLLCPPDIRLDYLSELSARADIDAVIFAGERTAAMSDAFASRLALTLPAGTALEAAPEIETRWLLLTSGTTGIPKIVRHTFASLTAAIAPTPAAAPIPVWSTFYDIRRYGGLQIFLRAVTGRGSMVLSDAGEPVPAFFTRLAQHKATHVSGTPSHWRRALMAAAPGSLTLPYVRLSGEIADQMILDDLADAFPGAKVEHAFASTEAGVGFVVSDGKEGFPASYTQDDPKRGVLIRVIDNTLRLKSSGTAATYIGDSANALRDADGFVDTGDIVELRGDRYHFVGRVGGIMNVGGLKVHPEEVEAVINSHPSVQMSLVKARKNAFTGSVVVADIVLRPTLASRNEADLRSEILASCQTQLAKHKVPALLRFVERLDVAESGKLSRAHA